MTRVLVTGGAGVLGRHVMDRLNQAGYATRGMSRRERPAGLPVSVEWVPADLETGAGLEQALAGVDAIVHAASSAMSHTQQVDVEGTRRLAALAKAAGVGHLVYISIVGIERIPLGYYRAKVAGEAAVIDGGVPWTILRATQFHDLLDRFMRTYTRYPITPAPLDYKYQPVDAGEVADALVACVAAGPCGRAPDMGGPQVLTISQMLRPWLRARHLRRLVIPLPLPGALSHAFRNGYNTCPDHRQGRITWEEWLAKDVSPLERGD
jgi:uncharacterized protein YbjT (DUF2867 family)